MWLSADLPMPDDPAARPAQETAARVLICEDEGVTALRLHRTLAAMGYEVVGEARDGAAAVRLARALRPDVILMDVNMPELDGIEATAQIMADCPTAIVMLTAYSEPEVVQRALAAGASGYQVKPVDDQQLRPAITVARARFAELRQERAAAGSLAESYASQTLAIPGFQVASRYEPAAEAARVGGDFFDFFQLSEDRVGFVIGDVCGSGIATASFTAMARHVLRAYSLEDPSPARVLARLNQALYHQLSDECPFVTLFYGVLDWRAGLLTYGNAGHPPPVLCLPGQAACQLLANTGSLVGALPEMDYQEASLPLEPRAVLALVTDGVIEVRGPGGEMLGVEGVAAVVREHAEESADQIVAAIRECVWQLAGGSPGDDVAIVVIRHA
jgi:sigma-B regulation protein RsbU (phosphoserine phosphatase)